MFKNPFSFKGRIRRLEYGISLLLISFVFILIVLGINNEFEYQDSEFSKYTEPYDFYNPPYDPYEYDLIYIYTALLIPLFWFWLVQAFKRSHDIGNSGWWLLLLVPFSLFFPVFFFIYNVVLLVAEGDVGSNEYGEDPKKDERKNLSE